MAKMSRKSTNVPNLRFEEFENEWKTKTLIELGDFMGGGTPSSANTSFWDGEIPWVSSSDLDENNIHSIRISRFINQDAINNSATKLCIAPVILIVSRVGVGKVAYSTKSLCTSQDFMNIVNLKCSGLFLSYLLSITMRKAASSSQGTSIKGIPSGEIKSQKLLIPQKNEQQKIASFLSFIDERISTQNKIIAQLQTLMQGLGEQLFKQKIRFKDDNENDFPDWEEKKLGEIGETYNGLSGKTKDNFGSGERYIQYKQIFASFKIKIEGCRLVDVSGDENQKQVQYGDIFFTISSETPEEIGMSSVLLETVENVYLNSFCFGFRPNSLEILKPQFAQYFFRSETFRNDIITLAQGSTRYNLSKIEFMKLIIKLPCSEEQTLIANFLSSIDEKIEAEKNILQQYENQKNYLLQNMFV
jgi:type I restriction enzyme S subunit